LLEDLDYERERNRELFQIILASSRVSVAENKEEEKEEFHSVRPRYVPWHQRRRELERQRRTSKLTEAEELFERELDASKIG
jgi:hypothetical protein